MRHVTRSGEDTKDVALAVLVDGGIVQYAYDAAADMADGERIVAHKAIGENFLIAFARLNWIGEVIGEIRADQLFARYAGRLLGSFIHVGDLAFCIDGDERVE